MSRQCPYVTLPLMCLESGYTFGADLADQRLVFQREMREILKYGLKIREIQKLRILCPEVSVGIAYTV